MSQAWTTPGQVSTLTTWSYDSSGRVMAENGTTYLLDSAGLRFRRTKTDGSITYTVYGFGREPLMVFTKAPAGSLAWSKTMVYGFGQELREDRAGSPVSTIYLQSDQVGSPNYTTDASGALVNRSKNLPFGERMLDASPSAPKSIRRFTNHEEDPDSNAIYMQAREYLAAYGKFAEVDPAYDQTKDDPESWNLYNYTTNNPVTHTDPDGRMPVAPNNAIMEWDRDWDDAGSGLSNDPIFQSSGSSDMAADTQSAAVETKKVAGAESAPAAGAPPADKTAPDPKTTPTQTVNVVASTSVVQTNGGQADAAATAQMAKNHELDSQIKEVRDPNDPGLKKWAAIATPQVTDPILGAERRLTAMHHGLTGEVYASVVPDGNGGYKDVNILEVVAHQATIHVDREAVATIHAHYPVGSNKMSSNSFNNAANNPLLGDTVVARAANYGRGLASIVVHETGVTVFDPSVNTTYILPR